MHPLRYRRRRRAAELERAAVARDADRRAMALTTPSQGSCQSASSLTLPSAFRSATRVHGEENNVDMLPKFIDSLVELLDVIVVLG
jgi:hypothetical protein